MGISLLNTCLYGENRCGMLRSIYIIFEGTIHTQLHLKCIRLVSKRSSHVPLHEYITFVSEGSSHLPFKMHEVGFRAFKSPMYKHTDVTSLSRGYSLPQKVYTGLGLGRTYPDLPGSGRTCPDQVGLGRIKSDLIGSSRT